MPDSEADLSWLKVSPTSGKKDIQTEITVTATPNQSYDERNASLTITTETQTATLVVTQKQKDAILLTSDKIELPEEGGTFSVTLQSNIDVNFEIAPHCTSWIHEDNTRGLRDITFSFKADPNEFYESREGTIYFHGNGTTEEVTIFQGQKNALLLTQNPVYVKAAGEKIAIEISANIPYDWEITDGKTWLHPDQTRSMSSHTLYFICDAWDELETDREAKILFRSENGISVTQRVIQKRSGIIILDETTKEVNAAGGEFRVKYNANGKMSVHTPAWVEVISNGPATRGVEAYELWLRAAPNHSDTRQGELTIFDAINNVAKETITLMQGAAQIDVSTSVPQTGYNDARSHTFTIDINSNVPYTLELPDVVSSLGGNKYKLAANTKEGITSSHYINVLVNGYNKKSIHLSQSAPQTPRLYTTEYTADAGSGEVNVAFRTNCDLAFTIPSEYTWIKLSSKDISESGLSSDTWKFAVEANPNGSARTAKIHFTNNAGWSDDITIKQAGRISSVTADGTVNLVNPGELGSVLSDSQKATLEAMSVNGSVNGTDIMTIRQMATTGSLANLDFSKTRLKADNTKYFSGHVYSNAYPATIAKDDMIGNFMFYDTKLRKITLPSTAVEIGVFAFSKSEIGTVAIPASVTKLGTNCFEHCKSLVSATIPASVTDIPDYAFYGCTSLTTVNLSEGLKTIGNYAFTPKDATTTEGQLSNIAIPSTVTKIGNWAFNCTKITTVSIPAATKEIGINAFKECRNLRTATFVGSMETLPQGMFEMCSSLSSIKFPSGLKTIGKNALAHTAVQNLVIPEGVKTLGYGALEGAGNVSITLPSTLEEIGERALAQLSTLNNIVIPEKVAKIGRNAFAGPCYLKAIHLRPTTVPETDGPIFEGTFDYTGCVLYVPKGCKEAYASNRYWGKFKDIREE